MKFREFLNKVQSKFTYRQRFLFFSLIFALAIPLPTYWMIKNQNYIIYQNERKLQGLDYSSKLQTLLNQVIEYLLITFENKNSRFENLDSLERSIEYNFINLNILESNLNEQNRSFFFGEGFSKLPPFSSNSQLNVIRWKAIVNEKNKSISGEYLKLHQELIQSLLDQIDKVKLDFGLRLNTSSIVQSLIRNNFYRLPYNKTLFVKLYLEFSNKDISHFSDDEKVLFQVLIEEIKNMQNEIKISLAQAYQSYENEYVSSGKISFWIAKSNLSQYIYNVDLFLKWMQGSKEGMLQDLIFKSPYKLLIKSLRLNNTVWEMNNEISKAIILKQQSSFILERNFCILILVIATLIIIFFVYLRVLSKHFHALTNQINELSKGNFTKCFCSEAKDEFGPIGIAFDKMGMSVNAVVKELQNLGNQLTESIEHIKNTAKGQETIVADQEGNIKEIENTAGLIGSNSRELAKIMNELSSSSRENSLADEAKTKLNNIQNRLEELAYASSFILNNLEGINEKISNSKNLVAFLNRVSDQASLLSLNAAIETANVEEQKLSFFKITQEIKRFAEKTAKSTTEIHSIIQEMSSHATTVKQDANNSLREISESVQRLIAVSGEMNSIIKQGKEQVKKFEILNDIMQLQAYAAEDIIKSLSTMSQAAEENTQYTRVLHQTTAELGITAEELNKVVNLFF